MRHTVDCLFRACAYESDSEGIEKQRFEPLLVYRMHRGWKARSFAATDFPIRP